MAHMGRHLRNCVHRVVLSEPYRVLHWRRARRERRSNGEYSRRPSLGDQSPRNNGCRQSVHGNPTVDPGELDRPGRRHSSRDFGGRKGIGAALVPDFERLPGHRQLCRRSVAEETGPIGSLPSHDIFVLGNRYIIACWARQRRVDDSPSRLVFRLGIDNDGRSWTRLALHTCPTKLRIWRNGQI